MSVGDKSYDREGSKVYSELKQSPVRLAIERYTIFKLVESARPQLLDGASVLDLACGDGTYSRECVRRGAKRVVGLDMSEEILILARGKSLEIEEGKVGFFKADCSKLSEVRMALEGSGLKADSEEKFDVILVNWFFVNAKNEDELTEMVKVCAVYLKPGSGVMVGMNVHPDTLPRPPDFWKRYNLIRRTPNFDFEKDGAALREGELLEANVLNDEGKVVWSVQNYFWSRAKLQEVFRSQGLELEVVECSCDPTMVNDYWRGLLQTPPFSCLRAAANAS
uniref:Methyltransferase domain-containing protein n=1 Tax=Chromera velia CCMP2878 TaxID=1169474 RepID=A0A0G4G4M2_9ALVE|eukprot:Cvel_20131.t1-p1 / transcript=Cvel_20131.t1 / gene=Cvel_20131 / organism=Chromera_velia_CCMP2878 / gene_product=Probable protein arginine N-methyltransferase 6, putative / transcript_product=Probable protein arginine N-methyltransferase 6, putative / location=Cvel_scaffold1785:25057-26514(+) / protein_length=278 / sequence_SO=supercontig / SO=protein_coding / is_pseudo=false